MPKIIKSHIFIYVLAFFIFSAVNACFAEDVKILDNGLKLIVQEDHRNPIVVFSAFIDTGSASEGEYLGTGISHLVEHLLFKGTKKYPFGKLQETIHRFGGEIDAYTSYDYTGFSITILKEHEDIALDILKEMFSQPLFDDQEIKKEMNVIAREMDLTRDDPSRRISRLTFAAAYMKHPYSIPIIGYKENFEQLAKKDIVKYFRSKYTPENMTLSCVGDFDKGLITQKISFALEALPRGKNIQSLRQPEPKQIMARFREQKADIQGAYLNIAYHSTDIMNKDLYAMDLLAFILGIGETSILNDGVKIKEQLVLSIGASNYTPKDPGLFIISTVLEEENMEKALNSIFTKIEAVKTAGVKEDDLIKAKNNFIADYVYQKETIEAQANDLAQSQILTGSPHFFSKYIDNIKAVTLQEIQQAAKKYLNKENMTITAVTKSGIGLSDIAKNFSREGTKAVSKFAQADSLRKITLKNGLTIITNENHNLPIIALNVLFKGGLRVETKENNGISLITSQMFIDGTERMSREVLNKFYESKGIQLSTYSANNSMGVRLTAISDNIEPAIELISQLCIEPVFPADELQRELKEMRSAIDMQDNEIFNQGHRLLKEMLFKTHPYGLQNIGTYESINNITQATVINFHKGILASDNIVIGISGDFDAGNIDGLIEKYFSRISAKSGRLNQPDKEPSLTRYTEKTLNVDKDQSLLLLGFQGINLYDKDKYSLEILVDILASPSGILFKSIRDKKGLSYSTGAFNVNGIDPGYVVIYNFTSNKNIQNVKNLILKNLQQILRKGPSEDDIEKSKNYLKAMRKIDMQSNSSFIFSISLDELYGLGYNSYVDFDKNIDAVTKEDIIKAANRLLKIDKSALIILKGKQ